MRLTIGAARINSAIAGRGTVVREIAVKASAGEIVPVAGPELRIVRAADAIKRPNFQLVDAAAVIVVAQARGRIDLVAAVAARVRLLVPPVEATKSAIARRRRAEIIAVIVAADTAAAAGITRAPAAIEAVAAWAAAVMVEDTAVAAEEEDSVAAAAEAEDSAVAVGEAGAVEVAAAEEDVGDEQLR
jgi:hypothetical protein